MRFLRYHWNGQDKSGIVMNEMIEEIRWNQRDPWSYELTGNVCSMSDVELLPPCIPSKIIGIGLNYRSHAEELNLPLPKAPILFIKPSTSVIGPAGKIIIPHQSKRVDYEAELGVVIGKVTRNIPVEHARGQIWGYTCANDVTARDLQPKDGQWTLSKGFDTFAPIGPWIETDIDNPSSIQVIGLLNGKEVQRGGINDLVFSIDELIAYISACMTLLPGDIIFTGTPSGIGPLKDNDQFTVLVSSVGELTNQAVKDME